MPTVQDTTSRQQPDARPLGIVAVGLGALALVLAPTYLLSPYAYVAAVPALVGGLVARTDERTRKAGILAVLLAAVAALVATTVLIRT